MTNFSQKLSESLSIKLLLVSILILVLLIPTAFIKSLIKEREATRNSVINEINSKWGNNQTLVGPIISIPYYTYIKSEKRVIKQKKFAHFLPEELNINGEVIPEERYRSIYKVIVYNSSLKIIGIFKQPDFKDWKLSNEDILWDEATLSFGISDMRGITDELKINFNNKAYEVSPGMASNDIIHTGISTRIKLKEQETYDFNFELNLNGSESINFIPVGKTTVVEINSPWSSPSFGGNYLPDDRTINSDGFTANWQVLHLNRSFPQQWKGSAYEILSSAFGVNLIIPVDQYLKSYRAAKYALMFIGLTFVVFFFSEILNRIKIHPIQYLLVGFSICIFYVLLISLSEHISFTLAYLMSSIATISLITFFAKSVFKNINATVILFLVLTTLYLFLFTTLQLQDYALLFGSIGLFIALSIIMMLSKKINWYEPAKTKLAKH